MLQISMTECVEFVNPKKVVRQMATAEWEARALLLGINLLWEKN